jgi:hypothetical protein
VNFPEAVISRFIANTPSPITTAWSPYYEATIPAVSAVDNRIQLRPARTQECETEIENVVVLARLPGS